MGGYRLELVTARQLRAIALVAAAVMGLVVAGSAYLRPAPVTEAVPGAGVAAWDFISVSRGWVLLDDSRAVQNRVFGTADSGASWRELGRLPDGAVSQLHFYDSGSGVAKVLEDGAEGRPRMVRTLDGGLRWERLPVSEGLPPPLIATSRRSAGFGGGSEIRETLLGDSRRSLTLTRDGGRHWVQIRLPRPH